MPTVNGVMAHKSGLCIDTSNSLFKSTTGSTALKTSRGRIQQNETRSSSPSAFGAWHRGYVARKTLVRVGGGIGFFRVHVMLAGLDLYPPRHTHQVAQVPALVLEAYRSYDVGTHCPFKLSFSQPR